MFFSSMSNGFDTWSEKLQKVLQDWSTHLYCWHAVVLWAVNICYARSEQCRINREGSENIQLQLSKNTRLSPGETTQLLYASPHCSNILRSSQNSI